MDSKQRLHEIETYAAILVENKALSNPVLMPRMHPREANLDIDGLSTELHRCMQATSEIPIPLLDLDAEIKPDQADITQKKR